MLLPKNLIERHDAAAEQIEYAKNAAALKKYRRIYRKLEKQYAMEAAGYLIRVPKTGTEIISEGGIWTGGAPSCSYAGWMSQTSPCAPSR